MEYRNDYLILIPEDPQFQKGGQEIKLSSKFLAQFTYKMKVLHHGYDDLHHNNDIKENTYMVQGEIVETIV